MKVDRGKFSVLTKNEIMIFNDKVTILNFTESYKILTGCQWREGRQI